MNNLTEKRISREEIFKGVAMHLVRDEIMLPDGSKSVREISLHNGAAAVLPLLPDGRVIMVRQYRYAVGQITLEIPAGKLDYVGEDPESAARRELREETGATAEKITYLGKYLGSPAILDEKIHIFLAEGLEFGMTDPDDDEFIETVKIPLDTLVEMIMRGEVPDGKTQAAVMRVAYLLEKRNK